MLDLWWLEVYFPRCTLVAVVIRTTHLCILQMYARIRSRLQRNNSTKSYLDKAKGSYPRAMHICNGPVDTYEVRTPEEYFIFV